MVLEFISDYMEGDLWERLCDMCYRVKYQDEGYQKLPAISGGDGGIEGFTRTGIVYQCYCPERKYSEKEQYEHMRNKMTADIKKLLNESYAKRLKAFGVTLIKEWHFVIPEYGDTEIIRHAMSKTNEVLTAKKANPKIYDYIDDSFTILVKVADDFSDQIYRVVRNKFIDTKLNLTIKSIGDIDWTKCESDKVKNIDRKVRAVMGPNPDEEDVQFIIKRYIKYYLKGIEILKRLRISFSEVYEQIIGLEQSYKEQVSMQTRMNGNSSLNRKIFEDILEDFEKKLKDELEDFSWESILELKRDIVSSWLADCSMQFKSR